MKQRELEFEVVVGGSVPSEDVGPLKIIGVAEVFRTNITFAEIVEAIEKIAGKERKDNRRV